MNFNYFLTIFLAISFVIYFFISPYTIDQKGIQKIPLLEFTDFQTYEMRPSGLNMKLLGKEAKRFETYLQANDFTMFREQNGTTEVLWATQGHYENDLMTLTLGMRYINEAQDIVLESEKALVHLQHKTVDIRVPFVLTRYASQVTGSSLFLNQNSGTIQARDVKAHLVQEEEAR